MPTNAFNRRRIFVKGLGSFEVREIDPTAAASFSNVGALRSTTVNDVRQQVEIVGDTGRLLNVLSQDQKVSGVAELWQTSKDEFDLLTGSEAKLHAVRYGGQASPTAFQFWSFPVCRIAPSLSVSYKMGERVLPLLFGALNQSESLFTIPEYYMVERAGLMYLTGLNFWVDPRDGFTTSTVKLLDISGFEIHGTLGVNTLWNVGSAPFFLRFDGTTGTHYGDFGAPTTLNDDGSGDFAVEMWVKFPTGGAQEEMFGKKSVATDNTAGWAIYKNAANTITFRIGSGSASVAVTTTGTYLTTWKHLAVSVDRNGNAQMYGNGAADGSSASVAAIGTGTNAINVLLGKIGSALGQFDVGGVRVLRYAAGGLPSNIATIISNHYTAERAYYGV